MPRVWKMKDDERLGAMSAVSGTISADSAE